MRACWRVARGGPALAAGSRLLPLLLALSLLCAAAGAPSTRDADVATDVRVARGAARDQKAPAAPTGEYAEPAGSSTAAAAWASLPQEREASFSEPAEQQPYGATGLREGRGGAPAAGFGASAQEGNEEEEDDDSVEIEHGSAATLGAFEAWALAHGRDYPTAAERRRRLAIFTHNNAGIMQHNAGSAAATQQQQPQQQQQSPAAPAYRLAANEFADWTWEEFKARMLSGVRADAAACGAAGAGAGLGGSASAASPAASSSPESDPVSAPTVTDPELTSVDWRTGNEGGGVIGPTRDQGACAAGYAFAAAGAIEAALAIDTGRFVALSAQQLLDCSGHAGTRGCTGGLPGQALRYAAEPGAGAGTAAAYPYRGSRGRCRFDPRSRMAAVGGVSNVTGGNERHLRAALYNQPVAVAMAVGRDLRFYASGIYTPTDCSSDLADLDHAALVVGYAMGPVAAGGGGDHFILQSSWGTRWGQQGFFLLAMNGKNTCGVASCAAYPTVAPAP